MTTLRKALPFLLLALVAFWTFSHHGPLNPKVAYAQGTVDCSATFTFTHTSDQPKVSNLSGNTPCVNWRVTFTTTGTLAATVTFQTSADGTIWTSVPNTVCSSAVQPPCIFQGANPLTGTAQGMSYFASYGNYVRVSVTASGAGTGTVRMYGAKGATASAGGVGGGAPGPPGPTGPTGPTGATGPSGSSIAALSNLTPVTVSANTAADQTLQEVALTAGYMNTVKAANLIFGAGYLTIAALQTPTLEYKIKLCTVSGCGSGSVVTLADITSAASVSATANGWNLAVIAATVSNGATGTLEVAPAPGLTIDIGVAPSISSTLYNYSTPGASSPIDLTGVLYVDFTVATSVGNAGNSFTQDIAEVLPQGATAGGGGFTFATPYIQSGGNSYGPAFQLSPPPAAGWVGVNLGTTTITATAGGALNIPWQTVGAVDATRGYVQPVPGATYTLTIHCVQLNAYCGIMLYDQVSAKASTYFWGNGGTDVTARALLHFDWTNPTTYAAGPFNYPTSSMPHYTILRVQDNGANEIFSTSLDGVNFSQVSSVASGAFLTPTHVGIASGDLGNTASSNFPVSISVVSFSLTTP